MRISHEQRAYQSVTMPAGELHVMKGNIWGVKTYEISHGIILAPEIQTPILQRTPRDDILHRRIANMAHREQHRARGARGDGAEVLREGEHGPVRSPCQLVDRRWKEGEEKTMQCRREYELGSKSKKSYNPPIILNRPKIPILRIP